VDLVKETFVLMKKGEAAFASGDFQESVNSYERAIEIVEGFPDSYKFDKPAFIAQCKAGLSGACGQLTHFEDGLRYADEALEFYDRVGKFYGASGSPWYMANFNKGANLANLGRHAEGLEYIRRARNMISDAPEGAAERAKCDDAIAKLEKMQARETSPKGFWHKLRSGS